MSVTTHPSVIWLRSQLRRTGLTKVLGRLRSGKNYEAAVDEALLGALRPGDIAWDIGANVGLYTRKIAERVGAGGRVYAFEPSPANAAQLKANCATLANVTLLNCGLSSQAGRTKFLQGSDDIGATSRIVGAGDIGANALQDVELRRADDIVASGTAPVPDVVKIDVEGHEYDVLEGMADVLANRRLRTLIVEVHFGLLADAGRPEVPGLIERRLASNGFETRWIDPSHLLASRPDRAP